MEIKNYYYDMLLMRQQQAIITDSVIQNHRCHARHITALNLADLKFQWVNNRHA